MAALLSFSFLTICILSSSFLAISIFLFMRWLSSSSSVNGPRPAIISGGITLRPAIVSGGITEIKDLSFCKQLPELGKYAVDQYNLKLKEGEEGTLVFKKVVKAKHQLVSGTNYFLKVSAIQDGKPQLFDAVVYVNTNRENRLTSFDPSFD
ncbi:hypothetical protein MKX03_012972 [Papaver bracteatum]|nr:hypothetical protein MKX03_012972 [Papaver bracteatum]